MMVGRNEDLTPPLPPKNLYRKYGNFCKTNRPEFWILWELAVVTPSYFLHHSCKPHTTPL